MLNLRRTSGKYDSGKQMDVYWNKLLSSLICFKDGKTNRMHAGNEEMTIEVKSTSEYSNLNMLYSMLQAIMLLICYSYAHLSDLSTFKSHSRLGCANGTVSQFWRMNFSQLRSIRNRPILSLLICTLFANSVLVDAKRLTDLTFENGLIQFSLNGNLYTMVELNYRCFGEFRNFPYFDGCTLYLASDGSIYQFLREDFAPIRGRVSLKQVDAKLVLKFALLEIELINDPGEDNLNGAVVTILSTSKATIPLLSDDELKLIQTNTLFPVLKQIGRAPIFEDSFDLIDKDVLYIIVDYTMYPIEIPYKDEEIRQLELQISGLFDELGEKNAEIYGLLDENKAKQVRIEKLEKANKTLTTELAGKQTLITELARNQTQNLAKIQVLERQLGSQGKKTQNMTIIISVVLSAIIVVLIVTLIIKFVGCTCLHEDDKVPTNKDQTLCSEGRVMNPYISQDQNMEVLNH